MRGMLARRSRLVSAILVLVAAAGWLFLAPSRIGGSTDYVATHGDSMAPRFESGDLALIRPADDYRVGQIVAYRSAQLNTVVLHRIIGRDGARYVLKGDNNDFIDPERPGRAALIGRLWLRVPNGGFVLSWLDSKLIAGALTGGTALLVLFGAGRSRRRRGRRGQGAARPQPQGKRPVTGLHHPVVPSINGRTVLTAAVVASVAFLGLGLFAFSQPATKATTAKTPYVEKVDFAYGADAAAGPVYPGGAVKTGDPIFLRLVERLRVKVRYGFSAADQHRVAGTQEILLRLTSPTGWSRTIELAPRKSFKGDHTSTKVTLDLASLRSLIRRVERLTGAPQGGAYTLAVEPRVHLTGALAGQPLDTDFRPALSFQLDALQLRPGSGEATSGDQQDGLNPSRRGAVATSATTPNMLTISGHGLPVGTARWFALAGFLFAGATALLSGLRVRRQPSDPTARIHTRYRHLIVPIAGMAHTPGRPPIDVTSIDALVQLAERSERLILHHQSDGTDTYLVDDEGTTYRYQARPASQPPTLHSASANHARAMPAAASARA